MPTYDYQCENCAHAWEQEQRMSDDDIKKCPKCKKNTAKKQISLGSGFVLKGGGWYKDLYHKPSTPPPSSGDESKSVTAVSSTPADTTAATETKPAAEAKPKKTTKKGKSAS